jgi:purine nucleoside phosphorylase
MFKKVSTSLCRKILANMQTIISKEAMNRMPRRERLYRGNREAWYSDFSQTSDQEVRELLERAAYHQHRKRNHAAAMPDE